MAFDAYLQIGDIKGESTDDKHKGWIEVANVDWSVNQPRATSVSTAGGHTNGKAELSEATFTKLADLSSPVMFQHCAMGKTIPKAILEFYRADGEGKPICYFKLELENVMISTFHRSSGSGGTLAETVHLAYAKLKATYTQQKISGGAGGSTMGGWDAAANKVHS